MGDFPEWESIDIERLQREVSTRPNGPGRRCQTCRCWLRHTNPKKVCTPCDEKPRVPPKVERQDRTLTEKAVQLFWGRVEKNGGGCWGWSGPIQKGGAVFFVNGLGMLYARRVSYEIHHGTPPPGYLRSQCQTLGCVNPQHLQLKKTQQPRKEKLPEYLPALRRKLAKLGYRLERCDG